MDPQTLYNSPNALAPNYSLFRVAERCLLTGHSHQAWPDRSLNGQRQAWLDAAELVDKKWDRAFDMADKVRHGYYRLLDDDSRRSRTVGDEKLPLTDHLAELRTRIIRILLAWLVGALFAWNFSELIFSLQYHPYFLPELVPPIS